MNVKSRSQCSTFPLDILPPDGYCRLPCFWLCYLDLDNTPYISKERYIGRCFYSLSGYRYLGDGGTVAPIGVKFCTMKHIGRAQIFSSFGGGTP